MTVQLPQPHGPAECPPCNRLGGLMISPCGRTSVWNDFDGLRQHATMSFSRFRWFGRRGRGRRGRRSWIGSTLAVFRACLLRRGRKSGSQPHARTFTAPGEELDPAFSRDARMAAAYDVVSWPTVVTRTGPYGPTRGRSSRILRRPESNKLAIPKNREALAGTCQTHGPLSTGQQPAALDDYRASRNPRRSTADPSPRKAALVGGVPKVYSGARYIWRRRTSLGRLRPDSGSGWTAVRLLMGASPVRADVRWTAGIAANVRGERERPQPRRRGCLPVGWATLLPQWSVPFAR